MPRDEGEMFGFRLTRAGSVRGYLMVRLHCLACGKAHPRVYRVSQLRYLAKAGDRLREKPPGCRNEKCDAYSRPGRPAVGPEFHTTVAALVRRMSLGDSPSKAAARCRLTPGNAHALLLRYAAWKGGDAALDAALASLPAADLARGLAALGPVVRLRVLAVAARGDLSSLDPSE